MALMNRGHCVTAACANYSIFWVITCRFFSVSNANAALYHPSKRNKPSAEAPLFYEVHFSLVESKACLWFVIIVNNIAVYLKAVATVVLYSCHDFVHSSNQQIQARKWKCVIMLLSGFIQNYLAYLDNDNYRDDSMRVTRWCLECYSQGHLRKRYHNITRSQWMCVKQTLSSLQVTVLLKRTTSCPNSKRATARKNAGQTNHVPP